MNIINIFYFRKLETFGSLLLAMDRAIERVGIDAFDNRSLARLTHQR